MQTLVNAIGGKSGCFVADGIFVALLKLTLRANKLFVRRAAGVAVEIVRSCRGDKIITALLELLKSPNKSSRICVAECFATAVDVWREEELQPFLNAICSFFQCALSDAASEVRDIAKKSFHSLERRFPAECDELKNQLSPNVLKLIGAQSRKKVASFGEYIRSPEGRAKKQMCSFVQSEVPKLYSTSKQATDTKIPETGRKLNFLDSLKALGEIKSQRDAKLSAYGSTFNSANLAPAKPANSVNSSRNAVLPLELQSRVVKSEQNNYRIDAAKKTFHSNSTKFSFTETDGVQNGFDYSSLLKTLQESNDWETKQNACNNVVRLFESECLSDVQKHRVIACIVELFGNSHFRVVHSALEAFFTVLSGFNPSPEQSYDTALVRLTFIQINPAFKLKPDLLGLARMTTNLIINSQIMKPSNSVHDSPFSHSNNMWDSSINHDSVQQSSYDSIYLSPLCHLFELLWLPEMACNVKARQFLLRAICDGIAVIIKTDSQDFLYQLSRLQPRILFFVDKLYGEDNGALGGTLVAFVELLHQHFPSVVRSFHFKRIPRQKIGIFIEQLENETIHSIQPEYNLERLPCENVTVSTPSKISIDGAALESGECSLANGINSPTANSLKHFIPIDEQLINKEFANFSPFKPKTICPETCCIDGL